MLTPLASRQEEFLSFSVLCGFASARRKALPMLKSVPAWPQSRLDVPKTHQKSEHLSHGHEAVAYEEVSLNYDGCIMSLSSLPGRIFRWRGTTTATKTDKNVVKMRASDDTIVSRVLVRFFIPPTPCYGRSSWATVVFFVVALIAATTRGEFQLLSSVGQTHLSLGMSARTLCPRFIGAFDQIIPPASA